MVENVLFLILNLRKKPNSNFIRYVAYLYRMFSLLSVIKSQFNINNL